MQRQLGLDPAQDSGGDCGYGTTTNPGNRGSAKRSGGRDGGEVGGVARVAVEIRAKAGVVIALALAWPAEGGPYGHAVRAATFVDETPAKLLAVWLTKGAAWTKLVNNYGLFKDGRLRQFRQAEPGEALRLLGSVAVDLVEYLGVGR